jgi:hypothetical protein
MTLNLTNDFAAKRVLDRAFARQICDRCDEKFFEREIDNVWDFLTYLGMSDEEIYEYIFVYSRERKASAIRD